MGELRKYLEEAVAELENRIIPECDHNLYLNMGAALFAKRVLEQFPEVEVEVPDNVIPFPGPDESD